MLWALTKKRSIVRPYNSDFSIDNDMFYSLMKNDERNGTVAYTLQLKKNTRYTIIETLKGDIIYARKKRRKRKKLESWNTLALAQDICLVETK